MLARLAAVAFLASIFLAPSVHAEERRRCLPATAADLALRDGRAERFAVIARYLDGEVLRAELCETDGGLVYRVTLMDARGSVRRVLLDARSGRLVYHGR